MTTHELTPPPVSRRESEGLSLPWNQQAGKVRLRTQLTLRVAEAQGFGSSAFRPEPPIGRVEAGADTTTKVNVIGPNPMIAP